MLSERIYRQARLAARAALTLALALMMALAPALPPATAACKIGCAEFAADSVTMQFDPAALPTVYNYQFKNKCIDNFNSNSSDDTKIAIGDKANQWRRCDKDEKCPPTILTGGSGLTSVPGEGASAKNPKMYVDVACREECKKKS